MTRRNFPNFFPSNKNPQFSQQRVTPQTVKIALEFDAPTGRLSIGLNPPDLHPLSSCHLLAKALDGEIARAIQADRMIIRPNGESNGPEKNNPDDHGGGDNSSGGSPAAG